MVLAESQNLKERLKVLHTVYWEPMRCDVDTAICCIY